MSIFTFEYKPDGDRRVAMQVVVKKIEAAESSMARGRSSA